MKKYYRVILIAFIILIVSATAIMIGSVSKSLIGTRLMEKIDSIGDLPYFGEYFDVLDTDGPIYYDMFRQWNRHLVFISGTTSWNSITNLVRQFNLQLLPEGGIEIELEHMARSNGVDTDKITITFANNDPLAKGSHSRLGDNIYIRFRQSDSKFTILFFK